MNKRLESQFAKNSRRLHIHAFARLDRIIRNVSGQYIEKIMMRIT